MTFCWSDIIWNCWKYLTLSLGTSRINSLWPCDASVHGRSVSTLDHVMAWCCQAPSHYLIQLWNRVWIDPIPITKIYTVSWRDTYFPYILDNPVYPKNFHRFIRHLSDGLYRFYSNLWNLSSDIWAQPSEMSDVSDDFLKHCNHVSNASHMVPGPHFENVWCEPCSTWSNVELLSIRSSGTDLRAA